MSSICRVRRPISCFLSRSFGRGAQDQAALELGFSIVICDRRKSLSNTAARFFSLLKKFFSFLGSLIKMEHKSTTVAIGGTGAGWV